MGPVRGRRRFRICQKWLCSGRRAVTALPTWDSLVQTCPLVAQGTAPTWPRVSRNTHLSLSNQNGNPSHFIPEESLLGITILWAIQHPRPPTRQ